MATLAVLELNPDFRIGQTMGAVEFFCDALYGWRRPQAAVAAIEKQPFHFIRLPLCRVPADRFGRLERGASGATSCFAVRTLYRVVSASSRQPVRRYRHIRRRSIELLAVADEVESAIILACGLNGSGPAVRVDAAIYLRFDPNISQ